MSAADVAIITGVTVIPFALTWRMCPRPLPLGMAGWTGRASVDDKTSLVDEARAEQIAALRVEVEGLRVARSAYVAR
jgi:hypothetical protein